MRKFFLFFTMLLLMGTLGSCMHRFCQPPQKPIDLYLCKIHNIENSGKYFVLDFPNQAKHDACQETLIQWFKCHGIFPIDHEPYGFFLQDFLIALNSYRKFKFIPPPIQQLIGILSQEGVIVVDHVESYTYGPATNRHFWEKISITLAVQSVVSN